MKIVALLASYNRRDTTLSCLESFFDQDVAPEMQLAAVVADDGSADGTAEAISERFREARVIDAGGESFWAGAMAMAEAEARTGDPDFLLWLNDDVVLERHALMRMIDTTATVETPACIAVGAVTDPVTGELTYSGVEVPGIHPLRVSMVPPSDHPVEVDTFNGNVVLVSLEALRRVGPIDGVFAQGAADFDYGLRARDAQVPRLLAAGTVGVCARDGTSEPWADRSLPVRERWRVLIGEKGHPPRSRARYLRRHGGPAWPLFWISPYLRALPGLLRPPR